MNVRIADIYNTISGEVGYFHQGTPVTIVRFGGCNLKCGYCDTPDTQDKGSGVEVSINEVIKRVNGCGLSRILITGGEPLYQREAFQELIRVLMGMAYKVQVETNGTIQLIHGDGVQCWVMDYKMEAPPAFENMISLRCGDWLKFVIQNEKDFNKAKEVIKTLKGIGCRAQIAISPVFGGGITPSEIWKWMEQDKVDAVLNVQLHKLIDLP